MTSAKKVASKPKSPPKKRPSVAVKAKRAKVESVPAGGILSKWREKNKINQRDFAAKLDVRQATLCDWEKGKHLPRVDKALQIQKLTNGDVQVQSWERV